MLTKEDVEKYSIDRDENKKKSIDGMKDLVLVHLTDYIPKNGVINSTKDSGAYSVEDFAGVSYKVPSQRDTVHFAVNGAVEPNNGGNWDNCKYAIIIPFDKVDKSKFKGGTTSDLYTKGSVSIPEGAYLLCPETEREKLQDELGNKIEVIGFEGDKAKAYSNAFIQKLGYKQKGIGDFGWGLAREDKDEAVAENIFSENSFSVGVAHTFTMDSLEELMYADIIRTSKVAKIMKDMNIKMSNQENFILNKHTNNIGNDICVSSKQEYMEKMVDTLREIANINIPEDIITDINNVRNGNITESVKLEVEKSGITSGTIEIATSEVKKFDEGYTAEGAKYANESAKTAKDSAMASIADCVLKRRIVGEIRLAQMEKGLKAGKEIDVDEMSTILEYTTNDRVLQFLDAQGEKVEIQDSVRSDENLTKKYILGNLKLAQMEKRLNSGKEIDFNEISEIAEYITEDKKNELFLKNISSKTLDRLPSKYQSIVTTKMTEMVPGYMIDIHTTLDENGVDKKCFSIISNDNLVLSQEEKDKLGEAYIGEEVLMGGVALLELKPDMSVGESLKYIESIGKKLTDREKKGADLGKETLDMQKDVEYIDDTLASIVQQEQILENSKNTQSL